MYNFSPAFVNPQGSPIRALFKYLSEPGMISFAGGYPDPLLFDVEGLGEASVRAYKNSRACLEYGYTEGIPKMKAEVIRLMQQRGVEIKAENIIVTTGSQQGCDLVMRVLLGVGDHVFVEQPTYTTNIQAINTYQARISSVPVDADGMNVEVLEQMLETAASQNDLPKAVYSVPTFSNPSGATLSVQRRLRLLELAAKYHFVIIEDDPYSDLRFSGEPVPSLLALADQVPGAKPWVVHLASLSKIVAPGLRVGWVVAPDEIARRCSIAKQSADVGSSPWTQSIAAEYLASGRLDSQIAKIRAAYGAKCKALSSSLREVMGDALAFHEPAGGMFIWARLTGGLTADDLLRESIPRKVIFVPGAGFQANQPDPTVLRLSYASPTVAEVVEGAKRLGEALKAAQAAKASEVPVA